MKKFFFCYWLLAIGCLTATAQTDMTSHITNASFEQEAAGWQHKNMGAQGNSVFNIKDGNTYMEKWTGRGGSVGSAYLSQELSDLPPGNYELTARKRIRL